MGGGGGLLKNWEILSPNSCSFIDSRCGWGEKKWYIQYRSDRSVSGAPAIMILEKKRLAGEPGYRSRYLSHLLKWSLKKKDWLENPGIDPGTSRTCYNDPLKKKDWLENPGIDPGTSRMLSERSTMWASPPPLVSVFSCYSLVLTLLKHKCIHWSLTCVCAVGLAACF